MKKQSEIAALADGGIATKDDFGDAYVLGEDHPDLAAVLNRQYAATYGKVYGSGDRRNTKDGDWNTVIQPLFNVMRAEGYGLVWHPESKSKFGESILHGETLDGARTDASVKRLDAITLDIDSGTALEDVVVRIEELGLFAQVHTSYNCGKSEIELKHDDVMRKLSLTDTPDAAQVREYLTLHHKDRFETGFIDKCEIIDPRKHTRDGLKIVLRTPPLDKFRVIFPLAEPVELAELAPTLAQWKEIWGDKVTGVAVNLLGCTFDVTSTDVNRIWFLPRHPKNDGNWYSAVILGRPLTFEEIEPFSKAAYIKQRKASGDPFLAGDGGNERQQYTAPSGASLNDWHRKAKGRFLLVDALEAHASDRIRTAGGERDGTIHIECPFEGDHSTSGGTATMVMNPHANEKEVWTVFCHHDTCKGRHKLEFLQQMLADEWFPESVLTDEEFILDAEDSEPEPVTLKESAIERRIAAAELDSDSSDADVRAFLEGLMAEGADTATLARAKTVLTQKTAFGKSDLNRMMKAIHADVRASLPAKKSDAINVGDGYLPNIEATIEKLIAANADDPLLFSLAEQLTEVRNGRLKPLPVDPLTEVIARVVKFEKTVKMGENWIDISTAPPLDVVKNIAYRPHDDFALQLRGVVTSPFFTAGGALVTEPGYHADAQVYYDPPKDFSLANVPTTPTKKQATDSVRYIIEQVLADFPLGGLNRKEIMAQYNEGEGVPALANVLGLILLTFMRDMVDGPTPMHLFNKPTPGTGAGLITKVCHLIATGKPAPATAFPKNEDEAPKTLTSLLCSGIGWVNFDNVAHAIDCPELATALTEPVYMARPLGRTDTVEVEVRNVWSMTAIHSNLSAELARRTVLIDLDAQSAEPEKRTGWLHDDLPAFVIKDRAKLVQCCLTIIQYWISQGQKPCTGVVMGSYERYTAIMGGVLENVGVRGFLGNAQKLKEETANEDAATLNLFLAELASYPEGEKFRAGQLMGILNKGCAETDNEPIMINRLGYSKVDGTYKDPAKIGRWFSKIAKKPWIVRDGLEKIEVRFKEEYDKSTKSNRYVMTKKDLSEGAA